MFLKDLTPTEVELLYSCASLSLSVYDPILIGCESLTILTYQFVINPPKIKINKAVALKRC